MPKLIIQIPCFNEEETLGETLDALPKTVEGFDVVEVLVINDGSVDDTVAVAEKHGVDHVVSLQRNKGLATAFMTGLDAALRAGADVIVNTDADNQYTADDIPLLTAPILAGEAGTVVGARPIANIAHFSGLKKLLQRLGSKVVRLASGADVDDAPSGFRAFSRRAAVRLNVFNKYTYTLETLIQAEHKDIHVISVPIRVNGETRPSRLVRSMGSYVTRSLSTIARFFVVYRPFRFFMTLALVPFVMGIGIGLRFLYFYFVLDQGNGNIQSLILAALLIGLAAAFATVALLADLIAMNRRLIERLEWRLRQQELDAESTEGS